MSIGALRSEHSSSKVKIVVNFFFAGLFLLPGALFLESPSSALGIAGGASALIGVGLIVMTYRRNIGKSIKIYEEGVEIPGKGQFRFDSIDAIYIQAGRTTGSSGRSNYILKSFQFFSKDEKLFAIGPVFMNWITIGNEIEHEVTRRMLPKLMDQVRRGHEITFDDLRTASFARQVKWKVSLQGFIENDHAPIAWDKIKAIRTDDIDAGVMRVYLRDNQVGAAVLLYGSKNVNAMLGLMKLLLNRDEARAKANV